MLPTEDSPLTRDGTVLVLAHDRGLEHGPGKFEGVRERLDPETVFEMATHGAVTGFAAGKGPAETHSPSYEGDVTLLAKLNGTSSLWVGDPDSAVNWSVEHAAELVADAVGRNVWQHEEPHARPDTLEAAVFEGATADAALDALERVLTTPEDELADA